MILFQTFYRNFLEIQSLVGKKFLSDLLVRLLTDRISSDVKRIVVEYPYVDKDYRDTYYNDFAKRHTKFDRNCVRLHFFTNEFENINKELLSVSYATFRDSYRGFMILRDTKVKTIGRSYFDPRIIQDRADGFLALVKTTTHFRGFDFPTKAFPWMQQDGNITRCAHVALWSIIRYFSDKYSFYPERTIHQITALLESVQRKNPSVGMTIEQIAQILRDSNFYPGVYFRETMSKESFNRILYVMIESGLPYVAALTQGIAEGHAVAIIGHSPVKKATIQLNGRTGVIDSDELIDYLLGSDDNHIPYTRIEKEDGKSNKAIGNLYCFDNIGAVVVPFHEKMFLDVCAIFEGKSYRGCLYMIEKAYLDFPINTAIVRRVLLTSSKSYKQFIANKCDDEALRNKMLLVEMPKFIWIAEYSLPAEYDQKISGWNIILDATAMNYQQNIFITVRNRDKLIVNQNHDNDNNTLMQHNLVNDNEIQYTNNLEAL